MRTFAAVIFVTTTACQGIAQRLAGSGSRFFASIRLTFADETGSDWPDNDHNQRHSGKA
jgi:hypothetical protein